MTGRLILLVRGVRGSILSRALTVVFCGVLVLGLAGGMVCEALASPVTIAGPGNGAGQVERPVGVAVDQSTGSLFVSDDKNARVDLFASSGAFQAAFGFGVLDGAHQLESCSATCSPGLQGVAPGQFSSPRSVGVDSVTHDVYVANTTVHRVDEFDSAGGFVLMFGRNVDNGPHHPGNLCTAEYVAQGDSCGGEGENQIGSGPGEFDRGFLPVVVDGAGNVWVGDTNRVEEFNSKGEYSGEVSLPGVGEIPSLAMDAVGDFYVIGREYQGVRKYSPTGVLLYSIVQGEGEVASTVAFDDDRSEVIVGGQAVAKGAYVFSAFDAATGEKVEQWGAGEVVGTPGANGFSYPEENGIAVNENTQRLFAASAKSVEESAVQEFSFPAPGPLFRAGSLLGGPVGGTTATLNAILDPEGKETHYRFEYVDNATFEADVVEHGAGHGFDHATVLGEQSLPADFGEHPVSVALSGLQGETEYHFRVVATSECEVGKQCSTVEASTFVTLPPVQVDSLYVENVSGDSAELGAAIDPLGTSSAYRFEYVSETAYQAGLQASGNGFEEAVKMPVPDADLGSGSEDVIVAQIAQGLTTGTTYRYRAAAHNIGGERFSAIGTFRTWAPATGLPDGRQWELVSPPDKHGALFLAPGEPFIIQAASQGGAVTYMSSAPTEDTSAGYFSKVQVYSARETTGWASIDISLPQVKAGGATVGAGQEYRFFSEDLSTAIVQPFGPFVPTLSPAASEQTPFIRQIHSPESATSTCRPETSGCYRPLVTGCPSEGVCPPAVEEQADVPPGTVFGLNQATGQPCIGSHCGPTFRGASKDGSVAILESNIPLTAGAPAGTGGLYAWSNGSLQLVSVLPNGKPAVDVLKVPQLGWLDVNTRGAVSDDGLRVIWSAGGHLYERDLGNEKTVQLDAVQPKASGAKPGSEVLFQFASADGRTIYFTDEQDLTVDAKSGAGSPDLYRCTVGAEAATEQCSLADIAPGAGVQGLVIGGSADGEDVYFVADGALSAGSSIGDCANGRKAEPGKFCNLYVEGDGAIRLLAQVSGADYPDWSVQLNEHVAAVSNSGQWLTFMSERAFTGYDNRDVNSGQRDEEVFVYNASGPGRLFCVSCNPSGERPTGAEYGDVAKLWGGALVWPAQTWIAANLPGWIPYETSLALYEPRFLSDSGRLFFDSRDALVGNDRNETEDVYEYEPTNVGLGNELCTGASPGYEGAIEGCISLISSGTSSNESAFLDASSSGGDVFFLSAARLSRRDRDNAIDVYDAHACGVAGPCGEEEAPKAAPCDGDACQASVEPPSAVTPSSLVYSGLGNVLPSQPAPKGKPPTASQILKQSLRRCRRVHVARRRRACEKKARTVYRRALRAGAHGKAKK